MEDDAARPEPGGDELLRELRRLQGRAVEAEGPVYDAIMVRISAIQAQLATEDVRSQVTQVEEDLRRLVAKRDAAQDADIRTALSDAIEEKQRRLEELRTELDEDSELQEGLPSVPEQLTPERQAQIEGLIQQAQVARIRKQSQEVTKLLQDALAVAPHSPQVLELLGDDYLERRQYKAARDVYRRAVRLDPHNVGLERKLANVALKLEEANILLLGQSLEAAESAASARAGVFLSAMVPGLGQMAAGRYVKGGVILAGFLLAALIGWRMLGERAQQVNPSYTFAIPLVVAAMFWLWGIMDASTSGRQPRARLTDRPRPPVDLPFE